VSQPTNEAAMEVEFEMTPRDVRALRRYHLAHPLGPKQRGWGRISPARVACGLYIFVLLVAMWEIASGAAESLTAMTSLIGFAILELMLIGSILFLRSLKKWEAEHKARKEQENAPAWQRLALTPQGVVQTTRAAQVLYYWSSILRVGATDEHLFIYITTESAFVVSRRGFAVGAFEVFIQTAQRYHAEAQSAPGGERWNGAAASATPKATVLRAGDFCEKPAALQGPPIPQER
jgi:hypothetical protein